MEVEVKRSNNGWKTVAIIFIIIAAIEGAFIIWAMSLGLESIENENICSINICEGYDAYQYYDDTALCECYIGGELQHQEIVT